MSGEKKSRKKSPRQLALEILTRFEQRRLPLNLILQDTLAEVLLESREKAQLHELVFGTARWQIQLDWILRMFVRGTFQDLPVPVRVLLRLGLYQIRFLAGVPAYAAVSETVDLAKRVRLHRFTGMINGTLRNIIRRFEQIHLPEVGKAPLSALSIRYAFPEWMVKLFLDQYGLERTEKILSALNKRPQLWVRVNRKKLSPDDYATLLAERGIAARRSEILPEFFLLEEPSGKFSDLPGAAEGMISVQDLSAGLSASFVRPAEKETVADICAAPGGKITYLAETAADEVFFVAADISRNRLSLVKENCGRLCLAAISLLQADARQLPFRQVDWVLLDAPCSGLGTIRKNPDIKLRRKPEDIAHAAALQRSMIQEAARIVRPGGRLVYSTCTMIDRENQEIIEWFLQNNQDFRPDLPEELSQDLQVSEKGWLSLSPDEGEWDGAFVARLRRMKE